MFFPSKSGEDQIKEGLDRNLGLYSAGIWDLFVLADSVLSDDPPLKSRLGDAKSRWGDTNTI